jgi:pimeloyl-ACP methyl ester carboxylesterase
MPPAAIEPGLGVEYPFQSRFLDVGAGKLHYVDEGPRSGEPVLMLHGNPTWSFFYRRLVRALSPEHRCVVPDHLGCGLSDKPETWRYDLAGHIQNLEKLVLALDLERITLVLHDWGGPIGMGLARRHPRRIARLVVMNTAAFPFDRCPLRIRVCRAPVLGSFLVRRLNAFAGLAPRMAVARSLEPAARRGLGLPYDSYAHRIAVARFVRDIPLSSAHPSWAEVDAIGRSLDSFRDLPTCIVWGERDFCFTPRFREEWHRRFPEAEVHPLPRAGHWLLEDEPEEIVAIVKTFLDAHPLP